MVVFCLTRQYILFSLVERLKSENALIKTESLRINHQMWELFDKVKSQDVDVNISSNSLSVLNNQLLQMIDSLETLKEKHGNDRGEVD